MIEYIKGEITDLTPVSMVIEANGVGYLLAISLTTFRKLQESKEKVQRVLIHEVIREDTHDLYGFADDLERRLFRLLITVSGIGPSSGRLMLNTYPPEELARYIAEQNEHALRGVKGVGAKTAQRVIVELKDKVLLEIGEYGGGGSSVTDSMVSAENKELHEEAEKAFVALGYPSSAARKVVARLTKEDPDMGINDIIRKGLRMI